MLVDASQLPARLKVLFEQKSEDDIIDSLEYLNALFQLAQQDPEDPIFAEIISITPTLIPKILSIFHKYKGRQDEKGKKLALFSISVMGPLVVSSLPGIDCKLFLDTVKTFAFILQLKKKY